jgi:hypothetical protein
MSIHYWTKNGGNVKKHWKKLENESTSFQWFSAAMNGSNMKQLAICFCGIDTEKSPDLTPMKGPLQVYIHLRKSRSCCKVWMSQYRHWLDEWRMARRESPGERWRVFSCHQWREEYNRPRSDNNSLLDTAGKCVCKISRNDECCYSDVKTR